MYIRHIIYSSVIFLILDKTPEVHGLFCHPKYSNLPSKGRYCDDSERCCGTNNMDCCKDDKLPDVNIIEIPDSKSNTKTNPKPLDFSEPKIRDPFLSHLLFGRVQNNFQHPVNFPAENTFPKPYHFPQAAYPIRKPIYIPRETYNFDSIQPSIRNERNLVGSTKGFGKKTWAAIVSFFGACFAFCCRLFGCSKTKDDADAEANAQAEPPPYSEYATASAPPDPQDLQQRLLDSRPKAPVAIPLPYYPLNPPTQPYRSIST